MTQQLNFVPQMQKKVGHSCALVNFTNRCCSIKLHADQNKPPPCTSTRNKKTVQLRENITIQVPPSYH